MDVTESTPTLCHQPFRFLDLPTELRDMVLELCLVAPFEISFQAQQINTNPSEPLSILPLSDPSSSAGSEQSNVSKATVSCRKREFRGYESAPYPCKRCKPLAPELCSSCCIFRIQLQLFYVSKEVFEHAQTVFYSRNIFDFHQSGPPGKFLEIPGWTAVQFLRDRSVQSLRKIRQLWIDVDIYEIGFSGLLPPINDLERTAPCQYLRVNLQLHRLFLSGIILPPDVDKNPLNPGVWPWAQADGLDSVGVELCSMRVWIQEIFGAISSGGPSTLELDFHIGGDQLHPNVKAVAFMKMLRGLVLPDAHKWGNKGISVYNRHMEGRNRFKMSKDWRISSFEDKEGHSFIQNQITPKQHMWWQRRKPEAKANDPVHTEILQSANANDSANVSTGSVVLSTDSHQIGFDFRVTGTVDDLPGDALEDDNAYHDPDTGESLWYDSDEGSHSGSVDSALSIHGWEPYADEEGLLGDWDLVRAD
ncbi:hypothetical protein BU16DRAFT_36225 [Lophium mytilinum]|uniref:F-box domain-containing protein n=1 Tax=Lophium mytilinum TaxID=390894 RepID=A0A6A6REZ4_9PEZI|nr:hypothetical protein BU16DRAFT_36225 [Lophium mytilinum]